MSIYPPPNYTQPLSIFNPANYGDDGVVITKSYLDANYLKFPVAQAGSETLNNAIINGVLTAKSTSNFNDVLTMTNTDATKREIRTSYLKLLDSNNDVNKNTIIVHNGTNTDIICVVFFGAINFRVFNNLGQQSVPVIIDATNTLISNNLRATSTSEFRRPMIMNDTTDANNRKITSTFYDFYDAGSLPLSSVGTIYNQSGAMYIQNTFNGGSINLVVDNPAGTQISPLQLTHSSVLVNNTLDVVNNDMFVRGIRIGSGTGSGVRNTIVGTNSGGNITIGEDNVFVGNYCGNLSTSGYSNVIMGSFTGRNITTGGLHTFIGRDAGTLTTTGTRNTFIGRQAGYYNTGSNNVCIGGDADCSGNITNSIAIGSDVKATASNTIVLGLSNQTTQIAGNVNVNNVFSVGNATTTTNRLDISVDNAQNTTIRARTATPSTSAVIYLNLDFCTAGGVITSSTLGAMSPFALEMRRPIQFNYSSAPVSNSQLGYLTSATIAGVSYTSQALPNDLGNLALGVGTWAITLLISFQASGNHSYSTFSYGINSASATFPTAMPYLVSYMREPNLTINAVTITKQISMTLQLTAATTIYFVEQVVFGGGGNTTIGANYTYTRIG